MICIDYIRVILPKKRETVNDISRKIFDTLTLLKELDENVFSKWFEQGKSTKDALEKEVDLNIELICKIVEKEWDKKNTDLGSNFIFWTGKKNDLENFNISFRVGLMSQNPNLQNRIVLSFPFSKQAYLRKEDQITSSVLSILKKVWESNTVEVKTRSTKSE
jgi:hypothetical protein